MVATRRGVRVTSPTVNKSDESDAQATVSTGRITRSTAKQEDGTTKSEPEQDGSHLEKTVEKPQVSSPRSRVKRCTRSSRLHSPEHPSTPAGSTHEADESDLESCCSVASNPELLLTRSTRRRQVRKVALDTGETSDVESCSSAVSAPRSSRSTRSRRTAPEKPDPTEENPAPATEPVKVTKSQRRSTRTRSSAKPQPGEESDAESCTSVGAEQNVSVRRSTRSRRQTSSIPIYLEEASDSTTTPRSSRTKPEADAGRDCDSDGFESGPTYSIHNLRRGRSRGPKTTDSDSDLTDIHSPPLSPCSSRGRGTPSSSRTGSGHSSQRMSVQNCKVVLQMFAADSSFNDSVFESTVTEDAECTLVEDEESKTPEEKQDVTLEDAAPEEGLRDAEPEKNTDEDEEKRLTAEMSEVAVTSAGQQEELSAGEEIEDVQETATSPEPSEPHRSASVMVTEKDSEKIEEKEEFMETVAVPIQSVDCSSGSEPKSREEEGMEVSVEAPHVAQPVMVTSGQEQQVIVDSHAEQQQNDVLIQKPKVVSLLDSSDDEYSEEEHEEEDDDDEEEKEDEDEERAQTSNKSRAAAECLNRLFMIDTRPGEEADEDYYKEKSAEEVAGGREEEDEKCSEEEDEEDEEDDDDDDDDTQILFASRDAQVKELSSRIDPGIRVKDLGGLYINFDGGKSKPASSSWQKLKEKKSHDEVMKKSVMGADFEKKEAVQPYRDNKHKLKAEREKSTGDGWFNMKAPEVTKELKDDLHLLKIRGSLDPKRFYKKNDRDGFPKYFQVGTVVGNAADYYHSHIPKKQRKRTMVEELLADAEFRQANKKRYQKVVTEKAAQAAGKRNKKKNKFQKKRI